MTTLLGRREKVALPCDIGNGLSLDIATIGPDTARLLLGNSIGNRQLSTAHLKEICVAMELGTYRDYIYDPIRITDNGLLADGHHRLNAIVDTGITQKMMVLTGYTRDDFLAMDQGRKRSVMNTFQVLGFSYAGERTKVITTIDRLIRHSNPVISMLDLQDKGHFKGSPSNDNAVSLNSVIDNESMEKRIAYHRKHVNRAFAVPLGITVSMLVLHDAIDPELSERFWDGVVLGKDNALVNDGDPRGTLHRKLMLEKERIENAKKSRDRYRRSTLDRWDPVSLAVLIQHAFTKFADGVEHRSFKLNDSTSAKTWAKIHGAMQFQWLARAEEEGYMAVALNTRKLSRNS